MKKINHRIAKSKNKEMGYLRTNLDRAIFEKRIELIQSLPLFGQYIVLEFEKDFLATSASGPSYGGVLETIVNKYEGVFRNTTISPRPLMEASLLNSIGSKLPFTFSFLDFINKFTYVPNNYSQPYLVFTSSPNTGTNYVNWNNDFNTWSTCLSNKTDMKTGKFTWPRLYSVGTTGLKADMFELLDFGGSTRSWKNPSVALPIGTYYNSIKSPTYITDYKISVYGLKPSDFFQGMKDTIAVIKWLESENNSIEIRGNVDGVKIDGYEAVLSNQLDTINRISDIVASSNNQLIIDGQKKKDDLVALINQKNKDIQDQIAEKRKNVSELSNLSSSYSTILEAKKAELVASLQGV